MRRKQEHLLKYIKSLVVTCIWSLVSYNFREQEWLLRKLLKEAERSRKINSRLKEITMKYSIWWNRIFF